MPGKSLATRRARVISTPKAFASRRSQKGRFRSGQTGQTVNLLALRLRWFESSPAQFQSELLAAIADGGGRHDASPAKISIFDGPLLFVPRGWHVFATSPQRTFEPVFSWQLFDENAFSPASI